MSRDLENIPGEPEAELLVAFVNTRDVEEGTDAIGEPEALASWVADNVGESARPDPDPSGHGLVLDLRESLRALLRANNGGEASGDELAPLREAAARSRFRGSLGADDRLAIEPAGVGTEALEGRLLLAVERLQTLGVWERLKVCPADDCQWAFYDASRNHSRTWCSMEECGNRAKTRRYRRRKGAV